MTASDRTGMLEIKTEFLFTLALEVEVLDLGNTPYGSRRVGRFGGGSFEGPKLKGSVLPGGACWSCAATKSWRSKPGSPLRLMISSKST
jgi:hypothetical protein